MMNVSTVGISAEKRNINGYEPGKVSDGVMDVLHHAVVFLRWEITKFRVKGIE
jgi:hypothetical protein